MKFNRAIGYCGNVHPATSVAELLTSIEVNSSFIRDSVYPDDELPLGIWLSKTALDELSDSKAVAILKEKLDRARISAFTINGFPYGDFHQDVVKHSVYLPTWADDDRRAYTLALAALHDELLPEGAVSTISTLPLGWPNTDRQAVRATGGLRLEEKADDEFLKACAKQLRETVVALAESDRQTILCIEPEPGCILDCARDVCDFFEQYVYRYGGALERQLVRDYIGICHDVCHSAVMFENQTDALSAYREFGIKVGKVQVSSAVEVDFDVLDDAEKQRAWDALGQFSEPRYLHQTTIKRGDQLHFFEDLNFARQSVMDAKHGGNPDGIWRVHFHVPIFADSLGAIGTTQSEIKACMKFMLDGVPVESDSNSKSNGESEGKSSGKNNDNSGAILMPHHFEVETYAWDVLPKNLQSSSLNDSIIHELKWFQSLMETLQ